jgi:hypothetical protein
MNYRIAFILVAAAMLVSPAPAQMRGAGISRGVGVSRGVVGGRGFTVDFGHGRIEHRFPREPIFIGDPFWYWGDDHRPAYEGAPPQVVVVQPPAAPAAPALTVAAVPPEPVVIEWQGDHFVRMTLAEASSRQRGPTDYSEKSNAKPRKLQAETPQELPPAVLVFRDGHREEVSKYTIIGPTMYTSADYWSSGTWTKKIQLADLDVPSTLKLNQERGVRFRLPTSPSEVVIRP